MVDEAGRAHGERVFSKKRAALHPTVCKRLLGRFQLRTAGHKRAVWSELRVSWLHPVAGFVEAIDVITCLLKFKFYKEGCGNCQALVVYALLIRAGLRNLACPVV